VDGVQLVIAVAGLMAFGECLVTSIAGDVDLTIPVGRQAASMLLLAGNDEAGRLVDDRVARQQFVGHCADNFGPPLVGLLRIQQRFAGALLGTD
jgi:hypothetical protein